MEIDDSVLPQKYKIDYVRIYKLRNGQSSIAVETAPDILTPERVKQLNEAIMPRLIQAMLGNTVQAVSSRIDNAFSEASHSSSYQLRLDGLRLGRQTTLTTILQKLPSYVKSLETGAMDWRRMLANSSFALSLQDNDSGSEAGTSLSLWGSGDYSKLSSKDTGLGWDGEVFSIQLGADQRIRDNLLLGGLVFLERWRRRLGHSG